MSWRALILDTDLPAHIGKAFVHILLWRVEKVFDQISGIDFEEAQSLLLYVYRFCPTLTCEAVGEQ